MAPLGYTVVKSALTFEKLAWTDAIPPETFSFFNVWRVMDDVAYGQEMLQEFDSSELAFA